MLPCEVPARRVANWAETRACVPARCFEPASEADVVDVVQAAAAAGARVSVVGAGHSPSDIAMVPEDGSGWMLSLDRFARVLAADPRSGVVRCQGGTRLKTLNAELARVGLAMPSLGSISEQSLAGAIATGTHGTGARFGLVSNGVLALRLVTGTGEVLALSRDDNDDGDERFFAALCAVGALGVVTELTYQACPAFRLRAREEPSTLRATLDALPALVRSADHFRFVWFPHTQQTRLVRMQRTQDAAAPARPSWFWDSLVGYHLLEAALLVARAAPALNRPITRLWTRLAANGAASERVDESPRVFNINCLFKQYVNEWAIPAEAAPEALRALQEWVEANAHVHFPVEVRFCAADDAWLSPCYRRDTCYIGVIMYRPYGKATPYKRYFSAYEDIMARFGGRPHWAKAFQCDTDYLRSVYPRFDDFVALARELDPRGVFWKGWHERVLGPNGGGRMRSRL